MELTQNNLQALLGSYSCFYVLKIYFNSVFITPHMMQLSSPYDATKFIDELKYHYPSNINATIEFEPILPQWLLSLLPFQCGNPPVFSAHINQS